MIALIYLLNVHTIETNSLYALARQSQILTPNQIQLEQSRILLYHPRSFEIGWGITMARVCQVTGKGPMSGNNISHANNKTKRRFLPNLQRRRFWVEAENRWVSLRLTNAALRTIDKNGIEVVLNDMRVRGEQI